MALIKVAMSLLKKQRAYAVTIFLLTFIVALILAVSATVINKAEPLYNKEYDDSAVSPPDLLYMYDMVTRGTDISAEKIYAFLKSNEYVDSFIEYDAVYVNSDMYHIDENAEKIAIDGTYFIQYNAGIFDFKMSTGERGFTLSGGEVIFPLLYESFYSLKTGDTVIIKGGEYTVAGFFEDPMFGSAITGMSRAFVSKDAFGGLYASVEAEGEFGRGKMLNVAVKGGLNADNFAKVKENLIDKFEEGTSYVNKTMLRELNLIIVNLVSVVLFSFGMLSLLITLFVLRYAVLSSIEGNFVTVGVYKAIGFSSSQIRLAIVLQYALICLLGAAAGVTAAIPCVPPIGSLLMITAGILWEGGLWLPAGAAVIIALTGTIGVIAWLNTGKIRKISPVRAISFGRAPVYFAERLNIPLMKISFLPLHIRMALKQMMTRRKQYVTLTVISALLAFMIVFVGGMGAIFNKIDNVVHMFGFPKSDVAIGLRQIGSENEKLLKAIGEIKDKYDVEKVYGNGYEYCNINDERPAAMVYETFEDVGFAEPLKGRFPKYDNEIALSPIVANRINKDVGDTVTLFYGKVSADYIVTGIAQCINELGDNIAIRTDGFKLIKPDYEDYNYSVIFKETGDKSVIAEEIRAAYDNEDFIVSTINEGQVAQILDSVNSVIIPATGISYGLAVVLIALITFLLAMITLYRENTDIGIFKSVGFTSAQIRLQTAIRFLLVSLTGGLIGAMLSLVASNPLVSFAFGFFGAPKASVVLSLTGMILPIGLICIIALVSSWLVSSRIKRVGGRALITE